MNKKEIHNLLKIENDKTTIFTNKELKMIDDYINELESYKYNLDRDYLRLEKENQELKKENKILRENAEHNDKVVDKFNWENQKLKEEIKRVDERNKELVKICQEFDDRINKAIDYIESNDIEVLKYHDIPSETTSYEIVTIDLLKILRGEDLFKILKEVE